MKKHLLVLVLLFFTVFSVFCSGSSEEQKQFLNSLPGFIKQENQTFPSAVSSAKENQSSAARGNAIIDRDMASLTRLYKYLEQNYLWEIDYPTVYEAMATAMFDALGDQYTYYVKQEDSDDYKENVSGKYGGLGFYFSKTFTEYQDKEKEETLYININQVFPNTPAARAGMSAGDFITHINGESVIEKSANDCSAIMKGDVGEAVTVTIKRKNTSFDVTMIREVISVPDIEYSMIDSETGYLYILRFYAGTYLQVKNALTDLIKQGMKKLVIDLRDCPGGDVDSTLSIADMFISSQKLLTINYKDQTKVQTKWASAETLVSPSVKVAILINGGSASSAEIFSSTMRDNKRAVLIGQKSYGKGIMQAITMWGEADTSVTVASFIPPSGNEIHKIGVMPDIETESITVLEDEVDEYTELYKSDLIPKFVDKHPQYTKTNVELFVRQHPEITLRDTIVKLMVRNEYYLRMTYDQRPKVDKWFDVDIQKALEVLENQ